ncbi:uncharacterized protein ATNIH1004_000291 [Aspergillus tanneri]|uniref:Mid2 domain-containing protein n=1 Tax=Aspergillus tanneri TaxID=1220188 RepID=A0A5M9N324_9EURO|nr:uncharacterized protein ATNIH1004_000291 [Aspergillus tanneri]KAA8651409.1 hypothetical protein ATNIH1004_000291 [Aspergillus tanneri]
MGDYWKWDGMPTVTWDIDGNPHPITYNSQPTYTDESNKYATTYYHTTPTTEIQQSKSTDDATATHQSLTTTAHQSTTTTTISATTSDSTLPTEAFSADTGGAGLPTKTKVAIAVPVSLVGAAILFALLFVFLRRRKKSRHAQSRPYVDLGSTGMNVPSHTAIAWASRSPVAPSFPESTHRQSVTQSNHTSLHDINTQARSQHAQVSDIGAGFTNSDRNGRIAGNHERNSSISEQQMLRDDSPRSPFDTALDDAVSEISRGSGRRIHGHYRGLSDRSSVSSFSGDEREHGRSRG